MHLQDKHPSLAVTKAIAKVKRAKLTKQQVTVMQSFTRTNVGLADSTQRMKYRQAHVYFYVKTKLPKDFFQDPVVQEWIQSFQPKCQFVSPSQLLEWGNCELNIFRACVRVFLDKCLSESLMNPCWQGVHDTVTLEDRNQYIQFGFLSNGPYTNKRLWSICIGLQKIDGSSDSTVQQKMNEICVDMLGKKYTEVAHSTISDYKARRVAHLFDHEKDGCEMHYTDKIAQFAIGDKVNSRQKKQINPFPDGQTLVNRAHDMAKYFSKRKVKPLWDWHSTSKPVPKIRPQTDICQTRVAARYYCIQSVLPLVNGFKGFASSASPQIATRLSMADEDWESLAEIEAVLSVLHKVTTIVQNETLHMGSLLYSIRVNLMETLRAKQFELIDLKNMSAKLPIPRKTKMVDDFSATGKMCVKRAIFEGEKRFCGGDKKQLEVIDRNLNHGPVICDDATKMSLYLDPRSRHIVKRWPRDQKVSIRNLLINEYISFGKKDPKITERILSMSNGRAGQSIESQFGDFSDDDSCTSSSAADSDALSDDPSLHFYRKKQARL